MLYKKASRLKLRFQTNKGLLTVEQLWGLTMTELKALIINLHNVIKKEEDTDLAFLEKEEVVEESEDKLRYDIAVDVYKTKQAEIKESHDEAERRAYNKHIDELIAAKEEENLRGLSVEELRKLKK